MNAQVWLLGWMASSREFGGYLFGSDAISSPSGWSQGPTSLPDPTASSRRL